MAQTTFGHSGWQLPLLPGNQAHDYHHSTVDAEEGPQNLGVLGCIDHMLGTHEKRNFRLLVLGV